MPGTPSWTSEEGEDSSSCSSPPPTLPRAESLCRKHGLRAYDAVQLSFALELDGTRQEFLLPGVRFYCADRELLLAAAAEGMTVREPGSPGP